MEDIAVHVACTVFIGILLFVYTKNPFYAGIFLLGGFILDVDHLVDYFFYYKNGFSLGKFLSSSYVLCFYSASSAAPRSY